MRPPRCELITPAAALALARIRRTRLRHVAVDGGAAWARERRAAAHPRGLLRERDRCDSCRSRPRHRRTRPWIGRLYRRQGSLQGCPGLANEGAWCVWSLPLTEDPSGPARSLCPAAHPHHDRAQPHWCLGQLWLHTLSYTGPGASHPKDWAVPRAHCSHSGARTHWPAEEEVAAVSRRCAGDASRYPPPSPNEDLVQVLADGACAPRLPPSAPRTVGPGGLTHWGRAFPSRRARFRRYQLQLTMIAAMHNAQATAKVTKRRFHDRNSGTNRWIVHE